MYKVKTDIEKNRIIITISGILTFDEAVDCKEAITKEIERLRPGFDVIDDISNFRYGQERAAPLLKEIMALLTSRNSKTIIRVVGGNQNGLIQFAKLTGDDLLINLKYVPTIKDAELILNKQTSITSKPQ